MTEFVDAVQQDEPAARPVPTVLTCGIAEENLANNQRMALRLTELGYPAELHTVRDAHNYVAWRDALHPHLTDLITDAGRSAVRREQVELDQGTLIAYGHYGRPVLVFPSEQGRAWDFENNGMIDAVADLIDAGRVKIYCVDSADSWTWSDRSGSIEDRARRHADYEAWIRSRVVGWISDDCAGQLDIITLGCSLGAYHAVNFALKHAHVFPLAIGLSGNYDPTTWHCVGRARRRDVLQQPDGLRRESERRSSRLAARAREHPARRRPGRVGGLADRCAAEHAARSLRRSRARASSANSTCGATTSRTTGRRGDDRLPTICRGSARNDIRGQIASDRIAARDRAGLADGVRGAGPSGRHRHRRRRHRAPATRPSA